MRRKLGRNLSFLTTFIAAIIFVVIFGGPNILRSYIENGIGGCKKIPILCKYPTQEIPKLAIEKEYIDTFIPYKFSKLSVSAPRGFAVIQELEKKPYYKKRLNRRRESAIHLFRQNPGYFLKLFPQVKAKDIKDNYDFIKRLTFADINQVKNLTDAFFVILKSIFTPDIGNQNKVVMASFNIPGKKGFISYNLFDKGYYFDCNVISDSGDFFKVYIKDMKASLEIKDVLAIISTLKNQD
jgi:hypothetical protein